jgi:phospholipid/cholesterol/gamma-HCH transport system substrate-binding protein
MPRTRSLAWSELKIGIAAVVAVLLVVTMVLAVGGEGGYWWQRYPLKARFDNIQGLKAGAVVRLSGKEIGSVTEVAFTGGPQVEVSFEVHKDVRALITSTSVAKIGSLSLLGEPIIDISTGQGGTPLDDWQYVNASQSLGPLDEVTGTATTSLEKINLLLDQIQSGRGTVGKLMTDDALYMELNAFIASAGRVTDSINAGQGTLGALVKDRAAYNSLKASLENLQTMTARINSGEGALGRFLNDEAMGKSLSNTMTNLDQVTAKLNTGQGTMGKLLTDQQLYDRLNAMTNKLDQVMANLQAGEGTAGQLLRDKKLYENMNGAVAEIQGLLAAIKADPKKYLNVKVSIF